MNDWTSKILLLVIAVGVWTLVPVLKTLDSNIQDVYSELDKLNEKVDDFKDPVNEVKDEVNAIREEAESISGGLCLNDRLCR